jgi:hypothetical protein
MGRLALGALAHTGWRGEIRFWILLLGLALFSVRASYVMLAASVEGRGERLWTGTGEEAPQ